MANPADGSDQPRNWLIYDKRTECFWGPNRGGYFKSLVDAGLYTEKEAKAAEEFAKRYERMEIAVPLEQYRVQVERLMEALGPSPLSVAYALVDAIVDHDKEKSGESGAV